MHVPAVSQVHRLTGPLIWFMIFFFLPSDAAVSSAAQNAASRTKNLKPPVKSQRTHLVKGSGWLIRYSSAFRTFIQPFFKCSINSRLSLDWHNVDSLVTLQVVRNACCWKLKYSDWKRVWLSMSGGKRAEIKYHHNLQNSIILSILLISCFLTELQRYKQEKDMWKCTEINLPLWHCKC